MQPYREVDCDSERWREVSMLVMLAVRIPAMQLLDTFEQAAALPHLPIPIGRIRLRVRVNVDTFTVAMLLPMRMVGRQGTAIYAKAHAGKVRRWSQSS